MTPEEDALDRTVRILARLGIPYMVTGSVATSYHGRPRSTHDTDIVIDPTAAQLETLIHNLEAAGFYVPTEGAREALRRRRQFNVIEMQASCKIDLIIRKDRPFSREEFARRRRVDLAFAHAVAMVTPEDAILSKLEWARTSGDPERQLRDVAGVLALNPSVDRGYIEHWATELGLMDLWRTVSVPDLRDRGPGHA